MSDLSHEGGPAALAPDPEQEQSDARALRTQAQILRWRRIAEQRRARWQAAQAEAAAHRRAWWDRWTRRAAAAFGVLAAIGAITALIVLPRAQAPVDAVMALDPMASGVEAPSEVAPVAQVSVVETVSIDLTDTPAPVSAPPTLHVHADTVRTWSDERYAWVTFHVITPDPAWMRFRDAAGDVALEDMLCFRPVDGVRRCRAGRTYVRLEQALQAGAAAGSWTVDVCTRHGCDAVTSFDVGATRSVPRT